MKLGNHRGITKRVFSNHAEWDQVFDFSKDSVQSSVVEIFVKENNKDDFLGRVWFDLNEVPKRVPPDSQLAPQWYRMEDKKGDKSKGGEHMVPYGLVLKLMKPLLRLGILKQRMCILMVCVL